MKKIILGLFLLNSLSALAKDMSRTESYEESYRELSDGTSEYIGSCGLHQDYENKYFVVTKTLIEYFEPRDVSPFELNQKLKNAETELLVAASAGADENYLSDVDDITLEKIESTKFPQLDLYRFNIGVGGGNGYYEFYARTMKNKKPHYQKLTNVFDGDLEFCDSLVWLKKVSL